MAINRNYLGALAQSLAGVMTDRYKRQDEQAAQAAYQDYKQKMFDREQEQLNARNDADNRSAMERLMKQLEAQAAEGERNRVYNAANRGVGSVKPEKTKGGLTELEEKNLFGNLDLAANDYISAQTNSELSPEQRVNAMRNAEQIWKSYRDILRKHGYNVPESLGASVDQFINNNYPAAGPEIPQNFYGNQGINNLQQSGTDSPVNGMNGGVVSPAMAQSLYDSLIPKQQFINTSNNPDQLVQHRQVGGKMWRKVPGGWELVN